MGWGQALLTSELFAQSQVRRACCCRAYAAAAVRRQMPRWTAAEAFGGREKRSQYGEVACFAGVRRVLPAHEQGVGGLGCGRVADDRPNLGRRCSGLLPSLPLRALAGRTGGIGSRPSVPHWWEGSNGYPRVLRPVAAKKQKDQKTKSRDDFGLFVCLFEPRKR